MKKTFALFLLLQLTRISFSEGQTTLQDIVYLKDGSIYKGTIVAQYPDSLVKIEIAGGSVIAVSKSQLFYIEYKVSSNTIHETGKNKDEAYVPKDHGYFNATTMGVLPGVNYFYDYYGGYSKTSVGFTIQSVHGYRFSPHLLAGAGLGIDIIQSPMIQLFADGRWEILKKKATPFVYGDAGYGIPLSKEFQDNNGTTTYKGGVTAGVGLGMRFNFSKEGAFLLEIGYKMEKSSEHVISEWSGTDVVNDYTYNRLAMRLGLAF